MAAIELGIQDRLYIGTLEAKRDRGHARDYVQGMWEILQADSASDYFLARGQAHTVREVIERAFGETGCRIVWTDAGVEERGLDAATGRCVVEVDLRYVRPLEVYHLLGDACKARRELGWEPKTKFAALVSEMVQCDRAALRRERAGGRRHPDAAEQRGFCLVAGRVN